METIQGGVVAANRKIHVGRNENDPVGHDIGPVSIQIEETSVFTGKIENMEIRFISAVSVFAVQEAGILETVGINRRNALYHHPSCVKKTKCPP
jgi:hypothetical protein